MPANEFVIISEHNPCLVLEVEGGSTNSNVRLITWPYHGGANQRFRFEKLDEFLSHRKNNCCLNITTFFILKKGLTQLDLLSMLVLGMYWTLKVVLCQVEE